MDKWAITRVKSDELIMIYKGTFMKVMRFVSKNYEDGDIDIESYENWRKRKYRELDSTERIKDSFEESIANGWIYS